jgi:predicted nucleic acid-binding OB-fold protein
MGVQIQPVSIWYNGQSKQASELDARIIFDDLATTAQFFYELKEVVENQELVISEEVQTAQEIYNDLTNVSRNNTVTLSNGNVSMDGQDYIDWDNSNEAAYAYVASKLNLTIV